MSHSAPRGMPILSGPPPIVESPTCRQCARDFSLFRRARSCGHCGYEYCSSCLSDGQALMPRREAPRATGPFAELREAFRGSEPSTSGYDPEAVCVHCLAMLQVTAAPLDMLRALPLKRLKEYLSAYNIPTSGIIEKEGLVEAIVGARNPYTGTLLPDNESYYRRRSVPRHGRATGQQPRTPPTARPPPPNYARPPPNTRPPRPQQSQPRPQQSQPRPQQSQPRPQQSQPRPQAPSQPKPQARPPPPVPSILSLVALPRSYLATLSIGTLKAILYENHVRIDFKHVLEKEDLIGRVAELVADERRRLERQAREEEREAAEAAEATAAKQPSPTAEAESEGSGQSGEEEKKAPKPTMSPPTGSAPDIERGVCVVCQDQEATLAVVDCGHLAMCAHCSDLVMATSKECPLCRTRIVTPQRLIRIYRV
ncbi:uncharacterized protein CcaverHIS019_0508580 [Cutaneotrichosporon cavernicola]|uniref:RING-type domain-containing protein n=1 Tax=Cutaneotrichosporon cavernicola TaxID=279322 RepID=A0AA48L7A3_9TREE|nr:uncharacterized protein CcaverHIS019_0508580 [Cutaneotrichosporon cavernicola]BEI93230.1 hypothetical protein CcaverHIS019_0508580 [Cutaneotrichosporon cavernicola]BEJ01007.1 hypothetical protein CcaverHIS631_0508640 [Cutaneotrichosporon cavernicola]BEJ08774.1 hypothetical protein CcaverHIS641_0508680 [Cutaneotrichosporon cavernicola]